MQLYEMLPKQLHYTYQLKETNRWVLNCIYKLIYLGIFVFEVCKCLWALSISFFDVSFWYAAVDNWQRTNVFSEYYTFCAVDYLRWPKVLEKCFSRICFQILYYRNLVKWAWWDWEAVWISNHPQGFDTVGWVALLINCKLPRAWFSRYLRAWNAVKS